MFPHAGLRDQVTAVLALFVTVAVNCCVWPSVRDTEVGEILTATAAGACSVILAVPETLVSKTLVAVTVILWLVAMEAGAVYRPLLGSIVPTCGLMLQVTPVTLIPDTTAENCCVCPALRVTLDGFTSTVIAMGVS